MRLKITVPAEYFKAAYQGGNDIFITSGNCPAVGEEIVFISSENSAFRMVVTVEEVYSGEDMITVCGISATDDVTAEPASAAFRFTVTTRPGRDLYRFEPFLEQLGQLWKRSPDTRFGQMMCGFSMWLQKNGYGDGFYLEDEKYLELLRQFIEPSDN